MELKLKYKDFPQMCRICLKKQNNLISIFDADFEDFKKVVYVFREVFSEKIIKNDGKPEQICTECIKRIKQVDEFVDLYYKSKKICEEVLELEKTTKNDEKIKHLCNFCGFDFDLDPSKKKIRKGRTRVLKKHILEEHLIEISSSNDFYKCLKCHINFKIYSDIEKHFLSAQHQNRTCSICKSQFNTVKSCFEHSKNCKYYKSTKKGVYVENENYKCVHCQIDLTGFEQVLNHFKEKHEKDRNCMICEKSVNLHMELHLHKHRPLRMKHLCLRCLNYFESASKLADHKKTFDHSKRQCDICKMVVPALKYSIHKASHRGENSCICELCGKSFTERSSYNRHYKIKHLGHRYHCDQCPRNYSTYNELLKHIARLHPNTKINKRPRKPKTHQIRFKALDEAKPNKKGLYKICDICNTKILHGNRRRIQLHEMWHRCGHVVMCLVPDCELTFASKGARIEHMTSDHEKFTCEECNKEFFNYNYFQSHCLVHFWQKNNNSNASDLFCRICNDNLPDTTSLSMHAIKKHNIYLCLQDKCEGVYATKPALQKHQESTHLAQKPPLTNQFVCSICNEKFPTETVYLAHRERHSELRKFKCDACSFTFSTAGQLRVHFRIHTGERPYVCRFCSKTFAYSHGRKLHERLHTGERPYSCPHCEQTFTDSSNRKKHLLQHDKKAINHSE